ncbi:MAG: hypothetical protein AAF197_03250, partial [Pseudomonadota bacterium]
MPYVVDDSDFSVQLDLLRALLIFLIVLVGIVIIRRQFWLFHWQLIQHRGEDVDEFHENASAVRQSKSLKVGVALLVGVLIYKLIPYLAAPGFYIEDTMEFSDAFSDRSGLFDAESYRYYRGYVVVVSEVLVNLFASLPAVWQPYLYIFSATSLLVLALVMLVASGIYRSGTVMVVAPVALLLMAFTDNTFIASMTGVLFSSTMLALAMSLRPLPSNGFKLLLWLSLVFVLVWSGPYGVQLLPFAVLMLVFYGAKSSTWSFAFLAFAAGSYLVVSAGGMTQFSNIFDPLIQADFFNSLIRHVLLFDLLDYPDYKLGLIIILGIVLTLYLLRDDRQFYKLSVAFLLVSLLSFLTYFISAKYAVYQGKFLSSHLIVSQACWIVFILLCVDRLAIRVNSNAAQASLCFALLLTIGAGGYAKERKLVWTTAYPPDPKLHEFLQTVDFAESLELSDDEYVQLWYAKPKTPFQILFTTSYRRGSTAEDAKIVTKDVFPEHLQQFVAPNDLKREINSMLDYHVGQQAMIYANIKYQALKRVMPMPEHLEAGK